MLFSPVSTSAELRSRSGFGGGQLYTRSIPVPYPFHTRSILPPNALHTCLDEGQGKMAEKAVPEIVPGTLQRARKVNVSCGGLTQANSRNSFRTKISGKVPYGALRPGNGAGKLC